MSLLRQRKMQKAFVLAKKLDVTFAPSADPINHLLRNAIAVSLIKHFLEETLKILRRFSTLKAILFDWVCGFFYLDHSQGSRMVALTKPSVLVT